MRWGCEYNMLSCKYDNVPLALCYSSLSLQDGIFPIDVTYIQVKNPYKQVENTKQKQWPRFCTCYQPGSHVVRQAARAGAVLGDSIVQLGGRAHLVYLSCISVLGGIFCDFYEWVFNFISVSWKFWCQGPIEIVIVAVAFIYKEVSLMILTRWQHRREAGSKAKIAENRSIEDEKLK